MTLTSHILRGRVCAPPLFALSLLGAATPAWADALSSNTLSMTLNFSPAVKNTFGFSQIAGFDVNGAKAPPGQGSLTTMSDIATMTLTAPQDVVFVSPNNTDSKTTAASLLLRFENLTGVGGLAPKPFAPMLTGTYAWSLDDSLVDNVTFDTASSAYYVSILVNGAEMFSDTLTVFSPDKKSGVGKFDLSALSLPANSITRVEARLGLTATASSRRPPADPPVPMIPPPPEPKYPTPVPEPATRAILLTGFGAIGAALRARRRAFGS